VKSQEEAAFVDPRDKREDDGKEETHAASSPSSVMTALVAVVA
jgi:hypothetical protein